MTTNADLIVLGTGAAATSAAYPCRSAGWNVAIVDSRPFGGTCQLRGCDPKKVLVGAAEVVDWARRMQGHGVAATDLTIAWPELMRFKHTFTDPVPHQIEQGFAEAGIVMFHGRARFVDRTAIQVGDETLVGRHVVVATGAQPASLHIPGEDLLTTSEQFLDLDALPRRIIFIGGGYISFEFAHVAARAGAAVQILHRGARPLGKFDPDLVDQLIQATRDFGIDVRLNTAVEALEKQGDQLIVHASAGGKAQTFTADLVVHGAGRVPEIADLDLDTAGVAHDRRGVTVNEHLQSISNPAVYAAGDAAASGGPPLTPVAGMEGSIVASNLLKGNHRTVDYAGVPTVVFTTPPLASVGLPEAGAREQGLQFTTHHEEMVGWYTSRRVRLPYASYKTLIEHDTGRILGAHLFGYHAEELINLFGLAIRAGLRADDLKDMAYAYPTGASDIVYMV
jgi:glutathione reductase (NADPH)